MVVLIVLCLGVEIFYAVGALYMLSNILLSLGNCMTTYWEIAAHSAYEIVSWYKYLIVILCFFFSSRFLEWESFFLISPFPDRCLL